MEALQLVIDASATMVGQLLSAEVSTSRPPRPDAAADAPVPPTIPAQCAPSPPSPPKPPPAAPSGPQVPLLRVHRAQRGPLQRRQGPSLARKLGVYRECAWPAPEPIPPPCTASASPIRQPTTTRQPAASTAEPTQTSCTTPEAAESTTTCSADGNSPLETSQASGPVQAVAAATTSDTGALSPIYAHTDSESASSLSAPEPTSTPRAERTQPSTPRSAQQMQALPAKMFPVLAASSAMPASRASRQPATADCPAGCCQPILPPLPGKRQNTYNVQILPAQAKPQSDRYMQQTRRSTASPTGVAMWGYLAEKRERHIQHQSQLLPLTQAYRRSPANTATIKSDGGGPLYIGGRTISAADPPACTVSLSWSSASLFTHQQRPSQGTSNDGSMAGEACSMVGSGLPAAPPGTPLIPTRISTQLLPTPFMPYTQQQSQHGLLNANSPLLIRSSASYTAS